MMRNFFFIIFTFLFLFSCQKKTNTTPKQKSTKLQIEKLTKVADNFYNTNNFDSAFYYYNKVKFICNPVTDALDYVSTLNRMADIQQSQGDYTGSESTVTEALLYLKYIKNQQYAWNSYVILSINYLNTYDYKNAILYNQKALQLKTEPWRNLAAKNNIAVILIEEEKYKESLEIFLSLITKEEVISDDLFYAKALDNVGFCYFKINQPKKALYYLNKSLKIRQKKGDPFDLGKSYLHLAKFYEKRNSSLAKKYMLLSYNQFIIANNTDERLTSLKLIIQNSSDIALKKYSTKYVNLVDSIFEVRQKVKNQFARVKYDSKREKNENLKLKTHKAENELQLEKQKNRNIISYIIIAISLTLIIVLYLYLTSRGKKEKIEATYKSETRIAKKLHDELANDIYHTMAFVENKNLALTENKEQLLNNLDIIYSRTRDISKENCAIITNENYVLGLKEMILEFNTSNTSIILNDLETVSWNTLDRSKKTTVYRVLQELLVNMKKHSNANLGVINFKETDKNITINYSDNGNGADLTQLSFKNGLHNVENRIQSIKGNVEIDSHPGKGFKVLIKIPL
ncbi:tetratricopeptide repeat-containing sensor histidine kinase [Flavobacterium sp. KBS0721]|uniref:tetratricopeptide repeat-containing sensor histidine kinase n=1 Tax=Flavobacterium sp. KBS0721 TaxID=1179672 RepID=UPI00098EDD8C|nr:tetratricopeptide repeat-containing sensor histidine kinase [Flavobacterium sp. KBS0721]